MPELSPFSDRGRRHRARMRAQGFRLVQLWVPDANAPGFRDRIAKQLVALRNSEQEREMNDWIERATSELDLSPFDDRPTDEREIGSR